MGGHELKIRSVDGDSIAEEMGLEPGDVVLKVDDREVKDYIDYRFLTAGNEMEILVRKHNGDYWLLDIEKDWDEEIGLDFENDGLGAIKSCRNKCIFCFVDQMPPEMRNSLYVKDDDYRLSFTHGNFITLTNTMGDELERIASMRLSPLYVSVHTTNPRLRAEMMRNPNAAKINEQLRYLTGSGIEVHAQAVLCPGINDGDELKRTVKDLSSLWPGIRSLALVPVGLTGYRENLFSLQSFTKAGAWEIIEMVRGWQSDFIKELEYPFVFAADEFYLLAGESFPEVEYYGGFPQIENGVGLSRLFLDEWEEIKDYLPRELGEGVSVNVITGELAAKVLKPVIDRLNTIKNLEIGLSVIKNEYFGTHVTVSGLLTARDIESQINTSGIDMVIVPGAALKEGERVFLDGPGINELSGKLDLPVAAAETPAELVKAVTGFLNRN